MLNPIVQWLDGEIHSYICRNCAFAFNYPFYIVSLAELLQ